MGLALPKFIEKGWSYTNEDNEICLKENAPEWAKQEYEEFLKMVNPIPDKNGIITQY